MKGVKKAGIFLLILTSLIGMAVPSYSHALTRDDILAQIQSLTQQIQYLEQQLSLLGQGGYNGGNNYGSCYSFNRNLRIGASGADVAALQSILQNSGFGISYNETAYSYYGRSTAAAVFMFQMNFYSEILAPYGYTHGTGFVGLATRNKLNQLSQNNCGGQNYNNNCSQYPYGNNCCNTTNNYPYNNNCCTYPYTNCNNNTSYGILSITSPSGGQTYQPGSNVYVAWSNVNYYYNYSYPTQNFRVELWNNGVLISGMNAGTLNNINFSLPTNLSYGSNYSFKVYDQNNSSLSGASQNFTVGYGNTSGNQNISLQASTNSTSVGSNVDFTANLYNFPSCGNSYSWNYGDGTPVGTAIESCAGTITNLYMRTITSRHSFARTGIFNVTVTVNGTASNSVQVYAN